jgi:hypothetical protein
MTWLVDPGNARTIPLGRGYEASDKQLINVFVIRKKPPQRTKAISEKSHTILLVFSSVFRVATTVT